MSNELITWKKLLRKAPHVARRIPGIVKAIPVLHGKDPQKSQGVGLTFEKATARHPSSTAILYEDQRYSYDEFNQWANRIAHYFYAQGLRKGDTVALFMENRPEFLVCILGLSKIGVTAALLNTSQTGSVLQHSFDLVKPRLFIIGEERLTEFNELLETTLKPSSDDRRFYFVADCNTRTYSGNAPDGYLNLMDEIHEASSRNPDTTLKVYAKDHAFYIYTSGTTGLPKAGIFTHGRWSKANATFGSVAMNLNPNDTLYSSLPLYHATGLCVAWNAAIAGSAGFAIRRKFSASQFWSDTRRYNATAIAYVGELCRYLCARPAAPNDRYNPVKKMVGNGLRPSIWGEFKQRFGIEEIFELYAASDGNIGFCNIFNFDKTVGFSPLPYQIAAYDKEKDELIKDDQGFLIPVEKGQTGLLLGGITDKSPLDGYTDDAKTQKVIIRDAFKKGDAYFNTGDLMRDIGFKHAQFVDRVGDTFRWKGENVSTTEVENVLDGFGGLTEAVVYGVQIPNTDGRAGMVSVTPTEPIDFKELYAYLKRSLPAYAVPIFVRVCQSINTTSTFKYQKSDLKKTAYNINECDDEMYVLLPGSDSYILIDNTVFENIEGGQYRF